MPSTLSGGPAASAASDGRRKWYHLRQQGDTMNAKLLLQILLTVGCLAITVGIVEAVLGQAWGLTPEGWWRGAMASWMLIVAIRMVYPAHAR